VGVTDCDLCERDGLELDMTRLCCVARLIASLPRNGMEGAANEYTRRFGHDMDALRAAVKARIRRQSESTLKRVAPR
jgi:hypothetical protein